LKPVLFKVPASLKLLVASTEGTDITILTIYCWFVSSTATVMFLH